MAESVSPYKHQITTKALVIEPDQPFARLVNVPREGQGFSALVHGWIEMLTLTPEVSAYINEEGKALAMARNKHGDLFVRAALYSSGRRLMEGDYICGPLVLVGAPDGAGWDTDVPDYVVEQVRSLGLEIAEEVGA